MVGCEFQIRFLNSKCSSYASHAHFFILGVILTHYTTLTFCVQASRVNYLKISSKYQHCGIHPAGVHDLECFNKINNLKQCVWKPGKHTYEKLYTLITRQTYSPGKEICNIYSNITQVSENIKIFTKYNTTAEIFENSESTNCTKAVVRVSANIWALVRCGPPDNVSFRRRSGKVEVNVSWPQEERNVITHYTVRYKTLNSHSWNESLVRSQNEVRCIVKNLNSSLVYNVQIQCVTNKECTQCPWSETYTIPSELTTQPEIDTFEDNYTVKEKGKRMLFLTWKFYGKELYDSYYVTFGKASGETPHERINTTRPELRLILSYSAFHINISAVNNVSISPAVSKTIPRREDVSSFADGRLNVTVHSKNSFTVYWKADLIKTYVCYSVEWRKKGHKTLYKSFFENEINSRTIEILSEPEHLKPYERYTLTLHTRPNKETCNMKRVNGSESTYGTTHFYFIEGTPVSAPANISSYDATLNSVVLEWSSIKEEDIRGFLLGYTIHYMEYRPRGAEINMTVDPESNRYKLGDLKSGTTYELQISGFTQAGRGVRSPSYIFKTNTQGFFYLSLKTVITVFAVVLTVLIFGPTIIRRIKVIVWPNIPNPGNSNTMQKIEGTCELELLESINTLKVEEWDTNSLQIVEKEAVIPANSLPLLHASEDEGETCTWTQTDTEDAAGGILPDTTTTDALSNMPRTDLHTSPFAYTSEYTTMEMFNQVMPQGIPANTGVTEAEESESEDADVTVVKSGLDYIRQFSTSPTLDNELSTFL